VALSVLHWHGTKTRRHQAVRRLFGGCHGGPDRKYKVLETEAGVLARNGIRSRTPRAIQGRDEFYYTLKFPKTARHVAGLLRQIDDEEPHRRLGVHARGRRPQLRLQRLHFHGMAVAEYRRLVTQGVLWTLTLNSGRRDAVK